MKKYILFFASALVLLWGCKSENNKTDSHEGHNHEAHDDHDHGNDSHEGHDHEHEHDGECDDSHENESDTAHGDEIIFTQAQAKKVGLETLTVKPSDFYQIIKTSGQILSAQGDEVTVSATSSGVVSYNKASVNEGLAVRAGESLLSISSKNTVDGDPIARARIAYNIAQKEYKRAESLIAEKLISEKEFNEIKLSYETAKIAYSAYASSETVKGAGMSSPISGFIKSKWVAEGQYVEVGQPLLVITQNKRLQLKADVSERYYKDLANITSANFKTPYDNKIHNLSQLNGGMISFARSVSSQEHFLPINFEFDNIGEIVSGSYVEVYLLSATRSNVISVPVTSLVEEQGTFYIYLKLDEEGYRKQEVKTGASDGNRIEIISGLKEGDEIVSKGANYVKLASASTTIAHGHSH